MSVDGFLACGPGARTGKRGEPSCPGVPVAFPIEERAERGRVIGMVMRGVLGQVLLGLAIGLPCAVVCVRFAEAMLYEVRGVDTTIMLRAILPLIVATCIAAIIPARRAASIDPVKALRVE
jgi:macrolide transport system ATP-binding/permease protein